MSQKKDVDNPIRELLNALLRKKWFRNLFVIVGIPALAMYFIWSSLSDNMRDRILNQLFIQDENLEWWSNLSPEWKKTLLISADCIPLDVDNLNKEEFTKIFDIVELDLQQKSFNDLQPLCIGKFKMLKKISNCSDLISLNGLSCAENIVFFELDNSKITDITELYRLTKLKALSIRGTDISLSQIESLKKMRNYELQIGQ